MHGIRAELKKDDNTVVLNAPCNNYGIDIALQTLAGTDMTQNDLTASMTGR